MGLAAVIVAMLVVLPCHPAVNFSPSFGQQLETTGVSEQSFALLKSLNRA